MPTSCTVTGATYKGNEDTYSQGARAADIWGVPAGQEDSEQGQMDKRVSRRVIGEGARAGRDPLRSPPHGGPGKRKSSRFSPRPLAASRPGFRSSRALLRPEAQVPARRNPCPGKVFKDV